MYMYIYIYIHTNIYTHTHVFLLGNLALWVDYKIFMLQLAFGMMAERRKTEQRCGKTVLSELTISHDLKRLNKISNQNLAHRS